MGTPLQLLARARETSWPTTGSRSEPAIGAAAAGALGLFVARTVTAPSPRGTLAVGAVVALLVVAAFGHLRQLLLALVIVDIPFEWDANLHYHAAEAKLGALGGLSVSVTTFAIVALYALWLVEAVLRPETAARPRFRGSAPLVAYVALSAISITAAVDKGLSQFELALLVQSFLVYLYVASHVRTLDDLRFVACVLLGGLLLEALIIVAARAGHSIPIPGADVRVDSGGRVGGTIGGPNTAASFMVALIVPAVAMLLASRQRVVRLLSLAAAVMGTLALVITQSRGGWISFGLSLLIFTAVGLWCGWLRLGQVVAVVAVTMLVLLPLFGVLLGRLETPDAGSARSRVPLNHLALSIARHHPLFGVGLNNLAPEMSRQANPQYADEWIYLVHNKYLLVAAEAGFATLGAFLLFLATTARRGLRQARRPGIAGPFAVAVGAALVGQMVHMTVEIFQSRPQVQLLWLCAGLLVAVQALPVERTAP